ncbi:unnamed protein product [Caenorhabditis bovis]|uniref:Uncharacterized protein n=1 Tax=Caenorhabditis bovis TaxID=2654633 RepID=A0A8S1EKY4_9PELO|nr:unnamed protein product [Caenorhabditis bovis]
MSAKNRPRDELGRFLPTPGRSSSRRSRSRSAVRSRGRSRRESVKSESLHTARSPSIVVATPEPLEVRPPHRPQHVHVAPWNDAIAFAIRLSILDGIAQPIRISQPLSLAIALVETRGTQNANASHRKTR